MFPHLNINDVNAVNALFDLARQIRSAEDIRRDNEEEQRDHDEDERGDFR